MKIEEAKAPFFPFYPVVPVYKLKGILTTMSFRLSHSGCKAACCQGHGNNLATNYVFGLQYLERVLAVYQGP